MLQTVFSGGNTGSDSFKIERRVILKEYLDTSIMLTYWELNPGLVLATVIDYMQSFPRSGSPKHRIILVVVILELGNYAAVASSAYDDGLALDAIHCIFTLADII